LGLVNGFTQTLSNLLARGSIRIGQYSHELVLSIASQHLAWTRGGL
jgi:hypothetical protein